MIIAVQILYSHWIDLRIIVVGFSNSATMRETFLERVGIELKRAERYSIFVSMSVLDFSHLKESYDSESGNKMNELLNIVRSNVRDIDLVSYLDNSQIGLLFPETSKQGAEIVLKRISDLIRRLQAESGIKRTADLIPLEMASYPETAGAKTVKTFIGELSGRMEN